MPKRPDEDLFAETTMSFGDHLEELRLALSKALIGLLVCFLLGLLIANYVVSYIQTPLKKALEGHYISKAISELHKEYPDEISPDIEQFIREKRFVYDKFYIEADEAARIGALVSEYQADRSANPQPTPSTPEAATESTDASATEADTASGRSILSWLSWGPDTAAGDPQASTRKEAVVLGGDVPLPQATFMVTRVWRPIDTVVKALNAQEAFMIWLKAAFVSGMVIASPYMFWQIWVFVAAGLYPHEKKYVVVYLPFSLVLFFCGAAMAFFVVFQYVLNFLFTFNAAMDIDPDPRISEWLSFVLMLPLGFGVAFQLPLVMLFLHRIGLFSIQVYWEKWRIAVLVIFVISMLLTPADPISMLLMALPLCFLYFMGIGLCRWMPKNKSPVGEGYDP
jgi:sec-independent protein translocase protein TatC